MKDVLPAGPTGAVAVAERAQVVEPGGAVFKIVPHTRLPEANRIRRQLHERIDQLSDEEVLDLLESSPIGRSS